MALAFPRTEILASFLDESPHFSETVASLGGRPVVVVPLLLGGGPHVLVDVVGALDAPRKAEAGRVTETDRVTETLTVLPPISEWPELASLTLEALDVVTGPPSGRETPDLGRSPVPVGAGYATVP